jgi:hypothetical protein
MKTINKSRDLLIRAGAVLLALGLVAACETTDSVNVTTSSTKGTGNSDGNGGDNAGNGDGNGDGGMIAGTGTVGTVADKAAGTGGKVLHIAGSTTLLLAAVIDGTGDKLPGPLGSTVNTVGGVVGTVGTKIDGLGTALQADGISAVPVVGSTVMVVDGLSAGLLKASAGSTTLLGYQSPTSNQLVTLSVLSPTPQTGSSAISAGVLSTGSVAKVSVGGSTLVDIPTSGGGTGGTGGLLGGGTGGTGGLLGGGTGGAGGAGGLVTGIVGTTTSTTGGLLNKVVSLN